MDEYFADISDFEEDWPSRSQGIGKTNKRQKKYLQKTVTARSDYKNINDLAVLFESGSMHLPRNYWCAGCLFSGFSDEGWSNSTSGVFPVVVRTSHPMYVLDVTQFGETVCPVTSRRQRPAKIIPKGVKLSVTGNVTDVDTYVLHKLSFPLAPEESIEETLTLRGIYPLEQLEDA